MTLTAVLRPCLVGLLLVSGVLRAQEAPRAADSLPFRRGQWAAQMTPDFLRGPTTLGVLKFTSPRRAWVLDGRVTIAKGFFVLRDSAGAPVDTVHTSTVAVDILVGRRFYRALARHTAGFVTVGAGGGFDLDRDLANTNAIRWLLFGEIGASYHPIHELSLGVFASLDAQYGDSKTRFAGGKMYETRGFALTWAFQPIILTLYF